MADGNGADQSDAPHFAQPVFGMASAAKQSETFQHGAVEDALMRAAYLVESRTGSFTRGRESRRPVSVGIPGAAPVSACSDSGRRCPGGGAAYCGRTPRRATKASEKLVIYTVAH